MPPALSRTCSSTTAASGARVSPASWAARHPTQMHPGAGQPSAGPVPTSRTCTGTANRMTAARLPATASARLSGVTMLLLSTADTDLLAARAVEDPTLPLRLANPSRVDDPTALLDDVRLVLVRLLGGRRAWEGFEPLRSACLDRGIPLVAVGGEGALDA